MRPIRLVAPLLALLVSACGFEPLYGSAEGRRVTTELAGVRIGEISDRQGQELRNALIDRFGSEVPAVVPRRWRMDVTLSETRPAAGVGVRGADVVLPYALTAAVRLVDLSSGAVAHSFNSTAQASIALVDSPFGTQQNQRAVRRQLSGELADRIAERVALFVRARPQT
jgi:LPS-assembly lipoprotein